jgi:hypothetical protein
VSRRHHPAAHRPGLAVPGRRPGCLLPSRGGLVDGRAPAHRARPGRPRHGHRPAQPISRPGVSLRPRPPGRIQLVVATPRSWRC